MVYRQSNPALNPKYFQPGMGSERMSLEGTISKTLTLLSFVGITALIAYSLCLQNPAYTGIFIIGGGIGGFILALAIFFIRPAQPQVLIGMYAILEGLFVGAFSFMVEYYYLGGSEGVVLQALAGTIAVFITMLTLYRMRIIQATQKFTLAVVSMGFAIMMIYLFNFILGFMGTSVPFLHSNGPIGIGISLIFTGVAALFLILDFAVIENGVRHGAPKNMEWYAALGLLITLVWLYIEMLKLVAKINSRD
ncbi:MAG: hypothetical protein CMA91_07615 [Euryarchaeota archaeon]|nr:hypothetical protein [Euryarchaeota archaeon]|tara:strand:+ start:2143 stop:2892 length:750 start_codon:yes stop_codon:yes gene_type:complete